MKSLAGFQTKDDYMLSQEHKKSQWPNFTKPA